MEAKRSRATTTADFLQSRRGFLLHAHELSVCCSNRVIFTDDKQNTDFPQWPVEQTWNRTEVLQVLFSSKITQSNSLNLNNGNWNGEVPRIFEWRIRRGLITGTSVTYPTWATGTLSESDLWVIGGENAPEKLLPQFGHPWNVTRLNITGTLSAGRSRQPEQIHIS